MHKTAIIALLSSAALSACVTSTNVMQTGPATWDVSATSDGLRSASDARSAALEKANQHCASMGKTIQVVSDRSQRTRMDIDTTYTVTFTCL